MMGRTCYVVMMRNDEDYDHYDEWIDKVFESIDDAITYVIDDLGCMMISEETLFFQRRFREGEPERYYNECNHLNGGQSVWIDKKEFFPNEWAEWEEYVIKSADLR